jgi:hypothetical protein
MTRLHIYISALLIAAGLFFVGAVPNALAKPKSADTRDCEARCNAQKTDSRATCAEDCKRSSKQRRPANPAAGPAQGGTMAPPATTQKPTRSTNPVLVRPPGGQIATPLSYTECKKLGCTAVNDDTCAYDDAQLFKKRCICQGTSGGVCIDVAK